MRLGRETDPRWEKGHRAEALRPSIDTSSINRSMGRGAEAGVDFLQVATMLVEATAMRGGDAAHTFWMRCGRGAAGLAWSLRRVPH